MTRYGLEYNSFSGYSLGECADGKYVKYSDVEELQKEVEHLREYTDHLVSFSKLPCLPKDLENLREANWALAVENISLRSSSEINLELYQIEIARLEKEIIGWKNKWECAIEMAAQAEFKLSKQSEYIFLKEGEVVRHNDEFLSDNGWYEPVSNSCVCQSGYPVGFPYRENFHQPMRRKVN